MDEMTRTPLSDSKREFLVVGGLLLLVIGALLGIIVHGLATQDDDDQVPLHVADVEGTWTSEDGTGARLLIRADGSVDVSKEAQIGGCGAPMWPDGRTVRAKWAFGDADDPRMVNLELRGPEAADACTFDFTVADEGNRTDDQWRTYVRHEDPH
ncbi:hypothetical protein [Streptomyces sp. NPDC059957]|uniref:hypothetical protein n=1 Tax=unclassified Streptomyces TaxID=2593676 RepID=UPI00365D5285